jgi:hypothetical protein
MTRLPRIAGSPTASARRLPPAVRRKTTFPVSKCVPRLVLSTNPVYVDLVDNTSRWVPTLIEDRNGNTLTFIYRPLNENFWPILDRIEASDGRVLEFLDANGNRCTYFANQFRRRALWGGRRAGMGQFLHFAERPVLPDASRRTSGVCVGVGLLFFGSSFDPEVLPAHRLKDPCRVSRSRPAQTPFGQGSHLWQTSARPRSRQPGPQPRRFPPPVPPEQRIATSRITPTHSELSDSTAAARLAALATVSHASYISHTPGCKPVERRRGLRPLSRRR